MVHPEQSREKPPPAQTGEVSSGSVKAQRGEAATKIKETIEYPPHLRELASELDALADLLDSSTIWDEQTHALWEELQDTLPGLINAGDVADIRATYIFESFWKFHRLAMKKMRKSEEMSPNKSGELELLKEQLTKTADEVNQVMDGQQMKVRTYEHLGQLGRHWRSFITLEGGNSGNEGRLSVLSPALLRKDGTCQVTEHAELE